LGGAAKLPPPPPQSAKVLDPPPPSGSSAQLVAGAKAYTNSCSVCHGNAAVAGSLNPDIRYSVALGNPKLWQQIVHDGLLKDNGMVAWKGQFTPAQIEAIRMWVIQRANEDKELEGTARAKPAVKKAT
ncbi:MAG TPA: cytochrome c, partial [Novosphingobium sp.]|nr:cytochrome c [Novosphingobium sp.]